MKREDFGFVMSRVMAVWLVATAIREIVIVPSIIQQAYLTWDAGPSTHRILLNSLAEEGVLIAGLIGLAVFLWTKPHLFCPPRADGEIESSKLDALALQNATLSALAVYFIAIGTAAVVGAWIERKAFGGFLDRYTRVENDWRRPAAEAVFGVAIYFWVNYRDHIKEVVSSRGDTE